MRSVQGWLWLLLALGMPLTATAAAPDCHLLSSAASIPEFADDCEPLDSLMCRLRVSSGSAIAPQFRDA